MKHLLLTTIAAVVLVGCGPSKPPDISIHNAAHSGDIEAIKQAIADGVNVNSKGIIGGSTPLLIAAMEGHNEVVELLISKGADVNTKHNIGHTPLDWAISNDQTETADLLRKHGGKTAEELKAGN